MFLPFWRIKMITNPGIDGPGDTQLRIIIIINSSSSSICIVSGTRGSCGAASCVACLRRATVNDVPRSLVSHRGDSINSQPLIDWWLVIVVSSMVSGGQWGGTGRLFVTAGWDRRLCRVECVFNWSPTRDSTACGSLYKHCWHSLTLYLTP